MVWQGLFALSVAATGWYYLFYSRAAQDLAAFEERGLNLRRIRLRRVGGLSMLLLGILFFAGFNAVEQDRPTAAFAAVWLSVCLLVLVVLALAVADVRLTVLLRQARLDALRKRHEKSAGPP